MKCFLLLVFTLYSAGNFDGALRHVHAEYHPDPVPEKAPPELVLMVAKESALLGTGNDTDFENDFDRKKILRSGDYWNAAWKEEITEKSPLRSFAPEKNLGSIKVQVQPGTEFYEAVLRLKKISQRLLYIINKK